VNLVQPVMPGAKPTASDRSTADPITVEVLRGALRAAQAEMEALIERTSMSHIVREKKDYFAGFFDPQGGLITGTPLPFFGHILQPIFDMYPPETMKPGDVYWYNDCYGSNGGTSHLNDQVFVQPVFFDGELVGFSQSWAHFTDVGGIISGSISPNATEIFHEGVVYPPTKLYDQGVLNEAIFRIFIRNTRFPLQTQGDTRAMIASLKLGERRLMEMCERFGPAVFADAVEQLNERTRKAVRAHLESLVPDGRYEFEDAINDDAQGNGPFPIRIAIERRGDTIVWDALKTCDQAPGPVNYLVNPAVPRMILGIYLYSIDPSLMVNEGFMATLDEVKLRPGSLLQPKHPAPLGQRGLTMLRLINMHSGLLNVATRGKANAGGSSYGLLFIRATGTKEAFLLGDAIGVGYGARPTSDGIDAVYLVSQENNPAEFLEQQYDARLLRYSINRDSGGPGKFRGGCGVVREIEWLGDEATMANRFDGRPAWGANGGKNAMYGRCFYIPAGSNEERELGPITEGTKLNKGDRVRIETGGGGGHGHPFDRPAERVLRDVLGGFVSVERARSDYGVAIDPETLTIDADATAGLRRERYPVKLFHRGNYYE
jgi:N-methylhydantoinase B